MKAFSRFHLTPAQIIILGFLLVILLGSLLLSLPISSAAGEFTAWLDALFTSVSAVCVTGLVVENTATYWSGFGHGVILTLIQIGGMGVVTLAVATVILSGRNISLMQRSTMQEAISAHHVGGVVRLTGFIVKTALAMEIAGALLLATVFVPRFGALQGLWYGLFHAVSAFCNAGFDLLGASVPFSSLTSLWDDPMIHLVIPGLILLGGIGFLTWEDVKTNGLHLRRYRLQSRIILLTTALLTVLGTLYFFFLEFGRPEWSEMSGFQRWMAAFFQAVTPRTAGFNTVDLTKMSETSHAMTILLMLTGGAPGSTAGGMKVTTLAIMLLSAKAVFQRREEVRCLRRRIDAETVHSASAIFLMYAVLFLAGGLLIAHMEGIPVLTAMYEAASAIGTVGLTLGITPTLGAGSKWVLMALMFLGRVGGLTVVFATLVPKIRYSAAYPAEKVTVG